MNSSTTHTSIWVPVSGFSWSHWADFFQQVTALVHRNLFHDDLQCFARSGLFARWKPREVVSIRDILRQEVSCLFPFFPSVARHFFQKRSPEPPRVMEVLVLTLSFLFIQTPAMRFPMSGGLWTCSTSKIKKKNTSAALLQITGINHTTTKGTTWNQRSHLFLLCAKKTSSQIQPCSTNGSRHEPKA